jgi:hypothetical protein
MGRKQDESKDKNGDGAETRRKKARIRIVDRKLSSRCTLTGDKQAIMMVMPLPPNESINNLRERRDQIIGVGTCCDVKKSKGWGEKCRE